MPPAGLPPSQACVRTGVRRRLLQPSGRLPAGCRLLCRFAGADIGPLPLSTDTSDWLLPWPCACRCLIPAAALP
eukprot:8929590-Alexandrium_andersonii.AAC.1